VGLGIKYFTDVVWAADFKDQWVDNPLFPTRLTLSREVELSMQSRVVAKADVVTATTEHILADLKDKHPRYADKMRLLPNGYDEEDFSPFPSRIRRERPLILVHVGSFYMKRSPENVFFALSKLRFLYSDLASRLRLRLIGYDGGLDLQGLTSHHGLDEIILIESEVDHRKSLQAMADADILLLVPGADYAIPGKLYEYMAAGRPILTLARPGSATMKIIEATQVGSVIDPGDPAALFNLLQKLIQAGDSSETERILRYEPRWPVIRQYSRESTARELTQSLLLKSVSSCGKKE
jgi:glycosyltransferase involved in cell wall biosynthesis